jgi:hypothetical protein
MIWEPQAREIAAQAEEIGSDAALISAAAWRARVDSRATQSLTEAAMTLWASRESLVRGGGRPLPHDREMIARASDLETDTSIWLQRARVTFDQASAALDAAFAAARAAAAQASAAKNDTEASAAASAMAETQRQAGDCQAALEILQDTGLRLQHAHACFVQVPEDLAETYEACYDLIRRGGKLPHDGDFITGTDPRRAA